MDFTDSSGHSPQITLHTSHRAFTPFFLATFNISAVTPPEPGALLFLSSWMAFFLFLLSGCPVLALLVLMHFQEIHRGLCRVLTIISPVDVIRETDAELELGQGCGVCGATMACVHHHTLFQTFDYFSSVLSNLFYCQYARLTVHQLSCLFADSLFLYLAVSWSICVSQFGWLSAVLSVRRAVGIGEGG